MVKGTGNGQNIELLFNCQNPNRISEYLFVLNVSPFRNLLVIISSTLIEKFLLFGIYLVE